MKKYENSIDSQKIQCYEVMKKFIQVMKSSYKKVHTGGSVKNFLWIFLMISAFSLMFIQSCSLPDDRIKEGDKCFCKKEIVKKMKFHGTLYAFQKNRKWYFYRNGKVCKLW